MGKISRLIIAGAVFFFSTGYGLSIDSGLFSIVRDGKPQATIVIDKVAFETTLVQPSRYIKMKPEQKIKLAAFNLQTYIEKMTGAKLEIVADTSPVSGYIICVGPSKLTRNIKGLKIPSGLTGERVEEGYTIFCRGNTLVLAGNDAGPYYGTYYAVAEFLEKLGVRWVMPGGFWRGCSEKINH